MLSRNIKYSLFVCLICFILTGCADQKTDSPASEKEVSNQEENDYEKFKTEDGKIEITIFNVGDFSVDKLKEIKEETLKFYNALQRENIAINSPETIYLHLSDDKKVSYTNDNTIHLYWVKEGNSPLIHELTHVLFGYSEGHLTQEGLAIYMQDTYSKKAVFPNFQEDVHGIMNYLLSQEISIPLMMLLSDEQIFTYTNLSKDTYSLRWLGYIESASFSNFLINQYGMGKFLEIYNCPDLADEISGVYGKELGELEIEWKEFVLENTTQNEETIRSYDSHILEIIKHLEANHVRILKAY